MTDSFDGFIAGGVVVILSDGTVTGFTPNSQADAFRGFTSTLPITSLMMARPPAGFNNIDNLIVGRVAAVPEAGTALMAALGLAALALRWRRLLR